MKEERKQELEKTVEGLKETFLVRPDAYATQTPTGQYYYVENRVTPALIMSHLKGEITLAAYLLDGDNFARYSVIDADDEASFQKLVKVHESLTLPSYLESSRRGGHLWFFFEERVTGKVARNFGLEIAKMYGVEGEVFPKQAQSKGPGSCIRLPFGVHRKTGMRYPFIGLGGWRSQLLALANPQKIRLEEVMSYQYQEPEKRPLTPRPEYLNGELPLWEKVKRQITVKELVEQYVDLKNGVGRCPFHDDQNPSFSVNEEENYWNCFAGCGGGSVIDFWMKMHELDFGEAVSDLAERLRIK